jgi:predicted phosphoribosyltransferase
VHRLGIPNAVIEATALGEQAELERREGAYRGQRSRVAVRDARVILVDDGLATGASMCAAVRALRQQQAALVTVAVPIGARQTCEQLSHEVDEVVCGEMPEPFYAIGTWYSNFLQTTDDEVRALLDRAAHQQRVRRVRGQQENAFAK